MSHGTISSTGFKAHMESFDNRPVLCSGNHFWLAQGAIFSRPNHPDKYSVLLGGQMCLLKFTLLAPLRGIAAKVRSNWPDRLKYGEAAADCKVGRTRDSSASVLFGLVDAALMP